MSVDARSLTWPKQNLGCRNKHGLHILGLK